MDEQQTFVEEGVLFVVDKEDDGKFVADIALQKGVPVNLVEPENWARVVGRFDSLGDAITAAKYEISRMVG